MLGVRPSRQLPSPDPRAVLDRRALLPARRELLDLRRQREVDDGRGVLVLDRAHAGDARARAARQRPAHGSVPRVDRGRAVARRGVARHRADLRGGRCHHHLPGLARSRSPGLRGDHRGDHVAAVGVVGRPVPVRSRVHDRHEVRLPARGGQRLVLGHVLPAGGAARLHHHRARRHRVRRDGRAPQSHRHGDRADLSHLRGARLPDPRQPAADRIAVESAPAAVRLPHPLPADGDRCPRVDHVARQLGQGPAGVVAALRGRGGRRRRSDHAVVSRGVRLDVRDAAGRRPRHRRRHLGVRMGAVPRRGPSRAGRSPTGGPGTTCSATRVARSTPSTTNWSPRWATSATNGLRPGAVGEQQRQRRVRHHDGADAASALDRRMHRLDGGPVLRGVGHDAVPLPERGGDVEAVVEPGAPAALREQRRGGRRAAHARPRRSLPDGAHARGEGRSRSAGRPRVHHHVGAVEHLRTPNREHRRAAHRAARRDRGARRRPARTQSRSRHELVPAPGRLGGDPGQRRPRVVAAGARSRSTSMPAWASPASAAATSTTSCRASRSRWSSSTR